jgi:hypothetical protein
VLLACQHEPAVGPTPGAAVTGTVEGVVGAARESALASLSRRMSAAARSSSWLGACCA